MGFRAKTSVFTSEDPLQPLPDLDPHPHPAVSDHYNSGRGTKTSMPSQSTQSHRS